MTPKYGSYEGKPVRFTDYEAWVFVKNTWQKTSPPEVLMTAAVMDESAYHKVFGDLPPVPSEAFKGSILDRLRLGPHSVDVTEQNLGKQIGIVGAPPTKKTSS